MNTGTKRPLVARPILQMPFVYNIPDSAYVDGKGRYDVSLAMASVFQRGTNDAS